MSNKKSELITSLYVLLVVFLPSSLGITGSHWQNASIIDYAYEFTNIIPLYGITDSALHMILEKNLHYIYPLIFNFLITIPIGIWHTHLNKGKYLSIRAVSLLCIKYSLLLSILYLIRLIMKLGSLDIDDLLLNNIGILTGIYFEKKASKLLS